MHEFLSSPDFAEISGIRRNLGEFGEIHEISEKFRGTQWNSVGFCMALSMNSVGIPGGFRGNAGFRENLEFGVVSGDLGGQKAFAQIAISELLESEITGFLVAIVGVEVRNW